MRRSWQATVFLLLFVAALAGAPMLLPEFYLTLLNYIGLYAIVALALVMLTGTGGLTSFGEAAFVGLDAYTSAYLTTAHGISPWLTLPAGLRYLEKQALGEPLRHLRAEGIGILLVEHGMDFVMGLADRVLVMEFGQKLAIGLPEEILLTH